VPALVWRAVTRKAARDLRAADRKLSDAHRAVQHFAVRDIVRTGKPLGPEEIATGTGIPENEVVAILDELERKMTFLARDAQGRVAWAYPVTAEETPHHMTFSTGERLDAA